jgi:hypothetical protein
VRKNFVKVAQLRVGIEAFADGAISCVVVVALEAALVFEAGNVPDLSKSKLPIGGHGGAGEAGASSVCVFTKSGCKAVGSRDAKIMASTKKRRVNVEEITSVAR